MSGRSIAAAVAQHYNQKREEGLKARRTSSIIHLRNFNNWIKSMLIGEYCKMCRKENRFAKIFALDIGAGKGGDLLKWKKSGVNHLVCVDIAEISVEQCKERYVDMKKRHIRQREKGLCFTAEFIVADFCEDHLKDRYANPGMKFDIVSCQFAVHYAFESYKKACTMMWNVRESLKPGGYFIGTIPDAYTLLGRLKEAPGSSFGNDLYSVKFYNEKDEEQWPVYGNKYDFKLADVVDCPEFLIYFPTFARLAQRYDMELLYAGKFDKYYEKMRKTREGKFLLSKMGVMEGTLSDSEWEVVCLYMVFAFKKMEPYLPDLSSDSDT